MKIKISIDDKTVEGEMSNDLMEPNSLLFREMIDVMFADLYAQIQLEAAKQ